MARILLFTVLGASLLSALRFLAEWIGIPFLPYLLDPLWMAPVAGAMIGMEAGRFLIPPARQAVWSLIYALLSRVAIGAFMVLAHSAAPRSRLGSHDGAWSTVVARQLLWALVTLAIAAASNLVAQRVVKEVSERPTGQM